jgi:hypothetical protein
MGRSRPIADIEDRCDDGGVTYRQIAAAACASLGLGCAPTPATLDRLIGFADPQNCEPNEAFGALLDGLVAHELAGEGYLPVLKTPLVPAEFRDQIGTPELKIDGREYRATLPLRGTWQNLPLRSVAVVGWIESEQGFELSFDADRTQVLATVNRLGLGIPPSGSEYREGDVMGLNIGVSEDEGGSTLHCIPG